MCKEEDEDPYAFKESAEDSLPSKSPGRPGRKPKLLAKQEPEIGSSSEDEEDSGKKTKRIAMRGRSRLLKNDPSSNSGSSDVESSKKSGDIKIEATRSDGDTSREPLHTETTSTAQTE